MSAPEPRKTFFQLFLAEMMFRFALGIGVMVLVAVLLVVGNAWWGGTGAVAGLVVGLVVGVAVAVRLDRARDRRYAARHPDPS